MSNFNKLMITIFVHVTDYFNFYRCFKSISADNNKSVKFQFFTNSVSKN